MQATAKGLALSDPSANSKFFTVSGAAHGGGESVTEVDWASAIMDWVEKGIAPTQLIYTFTQNSAVRSMPMCQFPTYAKYIGGNVNTASSYNCSL